MPPTTMQFPWRRFWVRHGESATMECGYFLEPAGNELHWHSHESNGVSLSSLKDIPLLVLLGDVGMGKTTTIQNEALTLEASLIGQQHAVLYRDLKHLTETQIYRQVFDDEKFQSWLRGEHALTLFLDSLDECWRRSHELESILVGEFETRLARTQQGDTRTSATAIRGDEAERHSEGTPKMRPSLFVRVACRSAEWRKETGHALQRLFTKYGQISESSEVLRTYTLAPLSQHNIRQAAACHGISGDELVERIAERDAQPLAAHPITFEMLLSVYLDRKDFPRTRRELFEAACARLSVEPDSAFGSPSQRLTTAPHRLAIARRLAATSVLTNRNALNGDVERPINRLDVLEVSDVFGYFPEENAGERVPVSRETATETLQTGLFSHPGDGPQRFRHPAYADYLTLEYLAERAVPNNQLIELLIDTTDNSARLIPQLEEAACWLAEVRPDIFDTLAQANADVFLRCELNSLSETQRKLLVESLLDLIRKHQAAEIDWQLKHRLARLNHSGIAQQLRSVITETAEHPLVRETAIDTANYCRCIGAAAALVDVFLNPQDVFRLRKHAGLALEEIADDKLRELLKARVSPENIAESTDELKGLLLRILWPSHLTFSEMLPFLALPRKQGCYRSFLEYQLPDSLPSVELPHVLHWLREKKADFDITGVLGYFPQKILRHALSQLSRPDVCNEIVQLIKSLGHQLHHFFHEGFADSGISPETRREFLGMLVASDLDLKELMSYGHLHQAKLLLAEDVPWVCTQYRCANNATYQDKWRHLILNSFRAENTDALDAVSELANRDTLIAEMLVKRTSCPLVPDEENSIKQDYLEEQREQAEPKPKKPSLEDRIKVALGAFRNGNMTGFWHIVELLQSDPTKEGGLIFPQIRLTAGKAWQALSPGIRYEIVVAIPDYLLQEQIIDAQVWDEEKSYWPCETASPLFVLLFEEAPDTLRRLSASMWHKWTPVLITYHDRHNGSHDEADKLIFALAAENAEDIFLNSTRRYLERYLNHDHKRSVLQAVATVWSPSMKTMVAEFIRSKALKSSTARALFEVLLQHEPYEARATLESLMQSRMETVSSVSAPIAGAILLANWPEEYGAKMFSIFREEPDFGRAVVPHLLRERQARGWLLKLRPHDTATFWDWLETNFPGDPYEYEDEGTIEARDVTVAHEVFHFRRAVLESLLKQGTREACSAMISLMQKRPQDFWLGDLLAQMRTSARRAVWLPPHPRQLMEFLARQEKRLIRTAGELHAVLVESILRYESTLHGNTPSVELWNCVSKRKSKTWDPKDENNVSDCLKRHIENDLALCGIIANREVKITRRFGQDPAEVVDLLVQAIPFREDGKPGFPVNVVVEVKCSWNRQLFDDMERQLYARYLARDFDFGIYLVAQFMCDVWNRKSDRRKAASAHKLAKQELQWRLSAQATRLSSEEKKVTAIVINAGVN